MVSYLTSMITQCRPTCSDSSVNCWSAALWLFTVIQQLNPHKHKLKPQEEITHLISSVIRMWFWNVGVWLVSLFLNPQNYKYSVFSSLHSNKPKNILFKNNFGTSVQKWYYSYKKYILIKLVNTPDVAPFILAPPSSLSEKYLLN